MDFFEEPDDYQASRLFFISWENCPCGLWELQGCSFFPENCPLELLEARACPRLCFFLAWPLGFLVHLPPVDATIQMRSLAWVSRGIV